MEIKPITIKPVVPAASGAAPAAEPPPDSGDNDFMRV